MTMTTLDSSRCCRVSADNIDQNCDGAELCYLDIDFDYGAMNGAGEPITVPSLNMVCGDAFRQSQIVRMEIMTSTQVLQKCTMMVLTPIAIDDFDQDDGAEAASRRTQLE